MGIKTTIIKPFAKRAQRKVMHWAKNPILAQEKVFDQLIQKAKNTRFGKAHGFEDKMTYQLFKSRVPIRDYEGIKHYVEEIINGTSDVLWPGKPKYFAKTSGTTSGVKYIPITKDSMPNHIETARNAIFCYMLDTKNNSLFDGKVIFLSGSPTLSQTGGIKTGRLSGIVNHEIPSWIAGKQLPSYETNCIEDWEVKVDRIVTETMDKDLRIISGIPPWVQMYYEQLIERTGKNNVSEIFRNFQLFIHGGVNYQPYASIMDDLVGKKVDTLETYPASEGFIAFQEAKGVEGLLLNVYSGIFFEFVPADQIFHPSPERLHLSDIELFKDYALIINNNAGLWAYNIGDTIQFVSKDPYRVIVSGRIKHFISAFGEHVIVKEVEQAMTEASRSLGIQVVEFTVAPQIKPSNDSLPYHEWFVEFDQIPTDLASLAEQVELHMQDQNIYYKDLIEGKILANLVIRPLKKDAFRDYMKQKGKLGGQNKVPKLSNDRKIALELQPWVV